jgi:tRNA pseudouridine synthase 10
MEEEIVLKIKGLFELIDYNICNNCLGRKFSNVFSKEWILNELKNNALDLDNFNDLNNFTDLNTTIDLNNILDSDMNFLLGLVIRNKLSLEDEKYLNYDNCQICENIFENLNKKDILDKINEKVEFLKLQYNNFLIGTKIPKEILEYDNEVNNILDIESENIKKELNRIIGEQLEITTKKEANLENPDVAIVVDLRNIFKAIKEDKPPVNELRKDLIKVKIQINPLFIEGRYLKLIRGIPQTEWPCSNCRGRGCEKCNFTGKMYDESIEELLYHEIEIATHAYKSKFHGAGREDIDVRMLGTGRPFVIELVEPKIRNLDLNQLSKKINSYCEGKAEFLDLKFVHKSRISELKVSSPNTFKVYCSIIESENKVSVDELEKLKSLNIIKQQTPTRVVHRRADLERIREVKEIDTYLINDHLFKMKIKTEGGLYIKELISGDNNRTKPSVSELLNNKCSCNQLDVIEVCK